MSYELVWGEATFDEIVATRDRGIIDCVDRHLRILAANPVRHGYRTNHPKPGTMAFDFHCDGHIGRYDLRAYFYYMENERDLRVYRITVAPAD
ncbi:MAG TPA: hypothetical protein VF306_14415 [Pirellulales bacterium]